MLTIPQFLDFPMDPDTKEIVSFFLKLLEKKNKDLFLHSQQVANYAVCTAVKMGLSVNEIAQVKMAALLHDIGQLSVPNATLIKYPYFNVREKAAYRRHCQMGASMLENISDLDHVAKIILHHHENWDGTGYPKRLKGVNIPIGSRIIAVCNYYDRKCKPCIRNWQRLGAQSVQSIKDNAGILFDPEVVRAFFAAVVQEKSTRQSKVSHSIRA
ncbi:MAG: HD domain-containing protein [Acidaminococcus sp.]|jgi:putative nucleotidyltransferase with HDIG domain|nr:HD domain-containing protein [Acidaminococcus sp.]MCI2100187.1 HD domain-containing protein [Acidaminococcus sp.]MCI2114506.1 HD domain-containing protein [Acidaminococcus sp.]MCI2116490.1 HD domain-containing protein [Acidaminococcus sp.]